MASAALVWEIMQGTGELPTLGPMAFMAVAVAYTISVLRVHDLTGEWTFF